MSRPTEAEPGALRDALAPHEGVTWRMVNPKTGWRSPHAYRAHASPSGAYWCVNCHRWENLDGEPFGAAAPAGATMPASPPPTRR